ncbi:hypothetical protein AAE478_005069 [Parahypoxylon ruwenzoriense]
MIRSQSRIYGGRLIAMITLVDALSSCWFGYCQGVFAGVLVSDNFKEQFPQTLDANVSGITASCFFFGAFAGSIIAFILGDKLGRKKTIALGLLCSFIGVILQFLAYHLPQMIIGRLVNGFGIGLTSTMTPVYLSECAKSHIRGKLVGIGASSNVTMFSLANWINYGLYFQRGPLQWRFPLAFQLIFPFMVAPLLFFVPETPRWLLLVGREENALEVLARLAGKAVEINDATVVAEFRTIKAAIELEREDRTPLMDVLCFRDKTHNFRRLLLSCGSQFMQQFSGINALGFYLPTLLTQDVGFSQEMSRLIAAVNGTIYFISAFGSLIIIDRFGRRNAEVNSLGWRTRGAAAATATNWLGGFAVTQFTKVGIDNLHWAFYLIFGVICFFYFPIVLLFYPETSNRTLEDMDHMFILNPSIFVLGNADMTQRRRPTSLIDAETERITRV